jgi:hypothetical protein
LLACLIVAPQRGYDEPAILSYAISSFCPTSADGLHQAEAATFARGLAEESDVPGQRTARPESTHYQASDQI